MFSCVYTLCALFYNYLLVCSMILLFASDVSQRALVEPWILPLIQGYVEIRTLVVHSSNPPDVLQAAQRSSQRGSHRDSEAGDEEEDEEDLMKIESNPTSEWINLESATCIDLFFQYKSMRLKTAPEVMHVSL